MQQVVEGFSGSCFLDVMVYEESIALAKSRIMLLCDFRCTCMPIYVADAGDVKRVFTSNWSFNNKLNYRYLLQVLCFH